MSATLRTARGPIDCPGTALATIGDAEVINMSDDNMKYDKIEDWQDAEVEVTVLAVDEAADGVPVVLGKVDGMQLELWSVTPPAFAAARLLERGTRIMAHITKCPPVISTRSYGGLRRTLDRIRFSRLLSLRPA